MKNTERVAAGADTRTLNRKNVRQQAHVGKEWETRKKDRVVKSVGSGEKRRHSHREELVGHAAFGEIAEGATADKASSGEKGTDLGPDARPCP